MEKATFRLDECDGNRKNADDEGEGKVDCCEGREEDAEAEESEAFYEVAGFGVEAEGTERLREEDGDYGRGEGEGCEGCCEVLGELVAGCIQYEESFLPLSRDS